MEPAPDRIRREVGCPEDRNLDAVEAVLAAIDDFLSAQDLHARLRTQGQSVGLATVYRTLQAMATDGDVDMMRTGDGEAVYRRCSSGNHHHHLVCRSCGRTVEVEGPTVERWADKIGADAYAEDAQEAVTKALELSQG